MTQIPPKTVTALQDVALERDHQRERYGEQAGKPLAEWVVVLAKHFGRLAGALLDGESTKGRTVIRWHAIRVAAVAVALAEAASEGGP